MEPDLRDALAQPRDLSDPLQILTVWVRIQLEVRLENLYLLLCKRGAHALCLLFLTSALVGGKLAIFICNNKDIVISMIY